MKIHVIMTDNTRHGVFPMMLYIRSIISSRIIIMLMI